MEKESDLISISISSSKDLALLIKQNYIVVIKISASWCGPCKNKKFLHDYHQIKSKYENMSGVKFVELDVDDDSDIIEDTKYYKIDIDSVPTFLISKKGSFTRKYIGCGYFEQIDEYLNEKLNKQND